MSAAHDERWSLQLLARFLRIGQTRIQSWTCGLGRSAQCHATESNYSARIHDPVVLRRLPSRRSLRSVDTDLDLRVLGPLQAERGGQTLNLGGAKQRVVLGILLLAPNAVVSKDTLIQAVWGEDASPSNARTLQVYLSKLRSELNPQRVPNQELIKTMPPGYTVSAAAQTLDLIHFQELVEEARALVHAGDLDTAVRRFRHGHALWTGLPLADLVANSDMVARESERLEITRLISLADCLDAELSLGRHSEVLPELYSLVDQHPLDERFRAQLMIALYRSGRHTDALESFAELQAALQEIGLEPGVQLRKIEEQILVHDPSLTRSVDSRSLVGSTLRLGSHNWVSAWIEGPFGATKLVRAVFTIGRAPDQDLVLDDPAVSRKHAEIRRVGHRFQVLDIGSTNGIALNGARVLDAELKDADVITAGKVQLVFRTGS